MKRLLFIVMVLAMRVSFAQTPIYSIKMDSVTGSQQIDLANYQGKKILIVNVATEDSLTSQLAELEQLYELYKDSVVVIGVPTNSFNTEPRSNVEIAAYCSTTYSLHFPLAAKQSVTGSSACDLYKWLTQKSLNTMTNSTVRKAFQKFLINKQGKLVAVFEGRISPVSATIRNLVEQL